MSISRRGFVVGLPLVVAGCVTHQSPNALLSEPGTDSSYLSMYAAVDTEPFPVPAIDLKRVKPKFLRRDVAYQTTERPGTIVVDPNKRFAYRSDDRPQGEMARMASNA